MKGGGQESATVSLHYLFLRRCWPDVYYKLLEMAKKMKLLNN